MKLQETELDAPGLPVVPRPPTATDIPPIRIEPSRAGCRSSCASSGSIASCCYFLIWRDVKVRYKQTVLGAAWAIIQPFFTMVVFSLFFGRLAKMPSDGMPYPIFAFAALVPWTFFANGLSAVLQQPGGQRQPDHEGLLSPPR